MQISSMEKLEITHGAIPPSKEEKGFYFISSWLCSAISFQWVQYGDGKNVELHSREKLKTWP